MYQYKLTQLIITSVLAGNILRQLPEPYLRVLRHPLVQIAVFMNILDSVGITPLLRRARIAAFLVACMNVGTAFLKQVYREEPSVGFHGTAVCLTTGILLAAQASRYQKLS